MGWRGAIRTIGAAARAADRENQRRYKAQLKQEIAQESAAAVEALDTFLENLVSVHANLAQSIDWRAMGAKQRPIDPRLGDAHRPVH